MYDCMYTYGVAHAVWYDRVTLSPQYTLWSPWQGIYGVLDRRRIVASMLGTLIVAWGINSVYLDTWTLRIWGPNSESVQKAHVRNRGPIFQIPSMQRK